MFLDPYRFRGKVLYRFDAVIKNQGGTMDLFRNPDNGDAMQAIWAGGVPDVKPDPNVEPSGPNVAIEDRSNVGASFTYSSAAGHNHWHFAAAARYELLLPGGSSRLADKVGFCMFDSYYTATYFKPNYVGVGPNTWCAPRDPGASFVREGISPGKADRYKSTVADQWIDVTGLAPGTYGLRATINPLGYIDESDSSNNVVTVDRVIPGATAADGSATNSGGNVDIPVSGRVVGPEIPARESSTCSVTFNSTNCTITASASGPLTFAINTQPAHGTATAINQSGLNATLRYTPDAGYLGADSFTYTTTDVRHLTSLPATVSINAGSGGSDDRTPPTITQAPTPSFGTPSTVNNSASSTSVVVDWAASDTSGICSYRLQQSTNGGAFSDVSIPSATSTSQTFRLAAGKTYRWQVQATDCQGNTSSFSAGPSSPLAAYQQTASSVLYSGAWSTATQSGAWGGSLAYSTKAGASATFSFTGRVVAFVTSLGSNRGEAQISIDGGSAETVDLYNATTMLRQVEYEHSFATSGAHTVTVTVVGTAGHARVDVDGFFTLG
jgi:Lysyl oxidase/Bacterial Ig domain